MLEVRPLSAAEARISRDDLVRLLRDAVEGGASVGFLLPLETEEAEIYWEGVADALAAGNCLLLAAFDGRGLIGQVQLGLEPRSNGRHRAEVMKLMVLRRARGRGIGRALMQAAIGAARARGRSLLMLDVRTGDPAEHLYSTLGFRKIGDVPGYARSPDGSLAPTSFHYLQLESSGTP